MRGFGTKTKSLAQQVRERLEGITPELVLESVEAGVTVTKDVIEIAWDMFDATDVAVYHGDKLIFKGHRGDPREKWMEAKNEEHPTLL